MAVIHIFFVDSQFTKYMKTELFGFTEFLCEYSIAALTIITVGRGHAIVSKFTVASTGGLLGLFLGFSFLSFMEIVYFSTMRLWCRLYRQRVSSKPTALQIHPLDNKKKMNYPFAN